MSHSVKIMYGSLPGETTRHPVGIDIVTRSGVRIGSANLSHGDEKTALRTAARWAATPELLDFAHELVDRLKATGAQAANDRAAEIEAVLEACR